MKPIKVLVIGDSGVGKTNLLLRYCDDNFVPTHLTTIGIDFKIKNFELDGKKLTMQIWDTAGQERYRTITHTYYKGASGIVLVYAVNDMNSFKSVDSWMKQISTHASSGVSLALIGNKIDVNNRVVSTEEGASMANRYGVPFKETSAMTGQNVEEVFTEMAKSIMSTMKQESALDEKSGGQKLRKDHETERPSKNCC